MRFEVEFLLDKPEIYTRDYRRVFVSIIKNALSSFAGGEAYQKFYDGTKQKGFCWCVLMDKPKFFENSIKLESERVKMVLSADDRDNTGYFLYSAFMGLVGKKINIYNTNGIGVKKVNLLSQKIISKNCCLFKTVVGTPFVVRNHSKELNKDICFYTSLDKEFDFELTQGLKRQAILAGFDEKDVGGIVAKNVNTKKMVVFHYDIFLDANAGMIEVCAKPEILRYFYQAGILAHHSSGFGMIDLVAQQEIIKE